MSSSLPSTAPGAPTAQQEQTPSSLQTSALPPAPATQNQGQPPNHDPNQQQQPSLASPLQPQQGGASPVLQQGYLTPLQTAQPGGQQQQQQQQQWYSAPPSPQPGYAAPPSPHAGYAAPPPPQPGHVQQYPPYYPPQGQYNSAPAGYGQMPPTNYAYPPQQQQDYQVPPPQQQPYAYAQTYPQQPQQQVPQQFQQQQFPQQTLGYNTGPIYGSYQPQGAIGGYQPPVQYPQYGIPNPENNQMFPTSTLNHMPPTAPSVHYPAEECSDDVKLIVKAFSALNTNEEVLMQVLCNRNHPIEIAQRKAAYKRDYPSKNKELIDIVNNKTYNFSGGFKSLTHALVAGPLDLDVFLLKEAIGGVGTVEYYLDWVLLCRSNEDIKAISDHYHATTARTLLSDLDGELSGDIRTFYRAVVRAERYWDDPAIPIPAQELERNIKELWAALVGQVTLAPVIKYFVHGSYHRLSSISKAWQAQTKQKSLEHTIKDKFSGHMEDALRYILSGATDQALLHATLLSKSLNKGLTSRRKTEEIAVLVAKIIWEDHKRADMAKAKNETYTKGDYLSEVGLKYRLQVQSGPERALNKDLVSKFHERTSDHFKEFLLRLWKQK